MVLYNLLSQAEAINQEQLLSDHSWLTPPFTTGINQLEAAGDSR